MKKFNKIFSILLTAALLTGMLVTTALPVSAGTQEWSETKTPARDGLLPNDVVASGLLTQAADGRFYAYVENSDGHNLAISDDGGKTWTMVKTPGATAGADAITAIATPPDNAEVVYIALGLDLWKSIDGGETFAKMATVPAGSAITAMDVAMAGTTYKVVAAVDDEVWFLDESNFFFTFGTIGTPSYNTNNSGFNVLDVVLSPDFATDKGIVVVGYNGSDLRVTYNVNGGAWGVAVTPIDETAASVTAASISLPAGFNILTSPAFYLGFDGAEGGVYRVLGNTGDLVLLPFFLTAQDVVSIDTVGTFAGAAIVAGTADGKVFTSANGGANWKTGKNLWATGDTLVALGDDFAANGQVYALQTAWFGPNDESGFSVSMDQGDYFAQISLINSAITNIDDAAFAGSGDMYLVTNGAGAGVGDSFTVEATAYGTGDAFTLTADTYGASDAFTLTANAYGAGDSFVLTATGSGPWTSTLASTGTFNVVITETGSVASSWDGTTNLVFGEAGDYATVTATAPGLMTWTETSSTGTVVPTVSHDSNSSITGIVTATQFPMDMNMTATLTGSVNIVPLSGSPVISGNVVTFINTTDSVTITVNTPWSVIWTETETGTIVAAETYDSNNSMTVGASGSSAFAMDRNLRFSVSGSVSVTGSFVNGATGAALVTVTATAPGSVTWTADEGTFTATEVYDSNTSMTVDTSTNPFLMDMNMRIGLATSGSYTTVGGFVNADIGDTHTIIATSTGDTTWSIIEGNFTVNAIYDPNGSITATVPSSPDTYEMDMNAIEANALWRNIDGWQRIGLGDFADVELSPNYATDNSVFLTDGTFILVSNNFGKLFTPQLASPGTLADYVVLDLQTFVVATGSDIFRTTTGGFLWNSVSTENAAVLERSSDGTALVAVVGGDTIMRSADNGATWGNKSAAFGSTIADVTFQQGSNTAVWATGGSLVKVVTATTASASWTTKPDSSNFTNGVGIVSGMPGDYAVYALDDDGYVSRILADATGADEIAPAQSVSTYVQMFIVPANGANELWVNTGERLYAYTDTLAVPVTGGAASGIATTQTSFLGFVTGASAATISWDALAEADEYTYAYGTTDPGKDLWDFSGTTDTTADTSVALTGLDPDSVYYVSVWANDPVSSFVGQFSFATPPTAPVIQGPGPAATGIPVNPTFQWGTVPGATSYIVELSTTPDFAEKTVLNATIPAVVWDTNAPLEYGTDYYWSVQTVTANGTSAKTYGGFTTELAEEPPATVTQTNPPNITLTQQPAPDQATPGYIWIIIAVGGILTVLVIVLIVRTRRVV